MLVTYGEGPLDGPSRNPTLPIAAVILAAGRGTRAAAGGQTAPKQYALLAGRSVLARCVTAFLAEPRITHIQVVIHRDDIAAYHASVANCLSPRLLEPAIGGATRQASGLAGLQALSALQPDIALIHDAARPFTSREVLGHVIDALVHAQGALPALPVADTLKRASSGGVIESTVDRAKLWRAQTPQGFGYQDILAAHIAAAQSGRTDFTDDASIAEWHGLAVALVPGDERNSKITTEQDLQVSERRLGSEMGMDVRTGTGFDVHKFCAGDHVWLGGIRIAHTRGLEGHSDADVVLHALVDALLGAIGDGDIGQHFPPSDARWKGAPSRLFLEDAVRRVRACNGRISNVDMTVLCEAPRIGPHRDAMRAAIAALLGIDVSRVGVKATTTEGLGFTGRREGIAAMASATVIIE